MDMNLARNVVLLYRVLRHSEVVGRYGGFCRRHCKGRINEKGVYE